MTTDLSVIGFHYFRLSRHLWELMLTRMRQSGADTLYTPVPWHVHEFEPSKIDLNGVTHPQRDLVGFVDLCTAMGFQLILDLTPGPVEGANLLNESVPGWLVRHHPEVRAKDATGNTLVTCTPIHPIFQKFATRWLTQVSETLANQQMPNGAIAGVQLKFAYAPDFIDHSGQITQVRWPVWLRKRYVEGGIGAINEAYNPPTPFRSVSDVELNMALSSPAFQDDRATFIEEIKGQVTDTYTHLLEDLGWHIHPTTLIPPHGFQVDADDIDIGASFEWAKEAPVQNDGSLRHPFWSLKQTHLARINVPSEVEETEITEETGSDSEPEATNQQPQNAVTLISPIATTIEATPTGGQAYRLLTSGLLLEVPSLDDQAQPVTIDDSGETDFYFTVSQPGEPLTGYLNTYLKSILRGQLEALRGVHQSAAQLVQALSPARKPQSPTAAPPMTEAQLSLQEASVALRRAAASIGALEEAFTTALNKPQPLTETPLLMTVDGSQLGEILEACQTTQNTLNTALSITINDRITLDEYQIAYQQLISAAEESVAILDEQLRWLRQQILSEDLSPSARTVHYFLESMLKTLVRGVMRQ
ncbi:MAG: beta-galactosidase [Chloroflexota bacterium]